MKNTGSHWLTTLVVFVAGVLLIAWHTRFDILQWVVVVVGLALAIPALYSFIIALGRKRRGEGNSDERTARTSTLWASVAAMALGIWMVINPSFFAGLLAYIFGAVLILYGIYHIVMMAYWLRPTAFPFWFYVIPVLMIAAGIVLLCTPVRTMNSVVVLMTGIALVASAVNSLLEYSTSYTATRASITAGPEDKEVSEGQ
ncbi:MAG: DUF308 domain-containing protein [Pseudoflavonifractor sp.]|nr:DUF308 domain-containing protein [Alloprevotella sp.]MCM1117507.1 DUF308 domain-containing protein [Pseudoflavonifractor sp.]